MEKTHWNFNNSYIQLPKALYSNTAPTLVRQPELVVVNHQLAADLGLDVQALQSKEGVLELGGNKLPVGAEPIAQAYAGHQFGHFTMLGDGRAVLLGEHLTEQGKRFDIQLKGAGRTPYSRRGDGRAALGPMLREYIISEAMHGLGIPTTRSLAVVKTGEAIIRESLLPGAILTRVADSHIRVGTFQFAAAQENVDLLRTLADYTIERHYPQIQNEENRYLALLREVIRRQAELISKWQLVGFIHGVMNTDNMAISGETIDYGPCAFMDTYDPATVFSSIDSQGRYAYGNQPYMALWNLARFAESLLPLLDEDEEQAMRLAETEIDKYSDLFSHSWLVGMRSKLGLFHEEKEDELLIKQLLEIMQKHRADYTNTFLALTFDKNVLKGDEWADWLKKWKERLSRQQESGEDVKRLMKANNPAIIPRNHRVEEALEAAVEQDDYEVMERLLKVLAHPYAHSVDQQEYQEVSLSKKPYQTFCGT